MVSSFLTQQKHDFTFDYIFFAQIGKLKLSDILNSQLLSFNPTKGTNW